jgi:hypothetical protein
MNENEVKYPKKDGAKKAAEMVDRLRKKEPSDRLVKIISEYGGPSSDQQKKSPDDQAAMPAET